MIRNLTSEVKEIVEMVHYRPAVSIILPFEPKMGLKAELDHSLKLAADQVKRELNEDYPEEVADLVMQKLRAIIRTLNYNTHKKSIAIYVSPVFQKVLYLDIAVKKKIIIDESFEVRDLVYSKKQLHKYLVLVLSGNESKIFLGNTDTFFRIVSNVAESGHAYVNDAPERVANFSDPASRKEKIMEKFLSQIDNSLDVILKSHQLPLFVLGTPKVIGHFRQLTKHSGTVVEYIQGNYEHKSAVQLKEVLAPHVADWKKVKHKDLLNQLEDAAGKKRLVTGMKEVWRHAAGQRGRLLLVEKDFRFAAERGGDEKLIQKLIEPYNKFSHIKDAVDDVIERVLEHGGDVEFVDKDVLRDHGHIALILFY